MKRLLAAFAVLFTLSGCAGMGVLPAAIGVCAGIQQCLQPSTAVSTVLDTSATSGTHVHALLPLGNESLDNGGMDHIAALVAKISGVTRVDIFDYYQTQDVLNEIMATPTSVKQIIIGFSCGANASPVVAAAVPRRFDGVFIIQASDWCGGAPLSANVARAQETYNPNCLDTGGLGCKLLDMAPGFNPSNFTVIQRPDCHICSDHDPDAQQDIVSAIRSVTSQKASAASKLARGRSVPGAVHMLVRYHGQPAY